MNTILMTGFEPFAGEVLNASLEAVRRLDGRDLDGLCRVVTCAVPVVRRQAIERVIEAVDRHDPRIVIGVGQAVGRTAITPERIAINVDDYRIEDNAGNRVVDEPVEPDGPAAYFTNLPIKAMVEALRRHGIPATVSDSAGTYVCNHLFYGLMHHIRRSNSPRRGGFIHVPLLPQQCPDGSRPTMALENIVAGLEIAARAAIRLDFLDP